MKGRCEVLGFAIAVPLELAVPVLVLTWRFAPADVAEEEDDLEADLLRLLRRSPPPTGTLRRAPPRVQYRRQVLQK